MKDNRNLSFWRKACRICACVDLVTQIIGVISFSEIYILYLPGYIASEEMNWQWKALIAIPIMLIMFIPIPFLACTIMLIKGTAKERRVQDVLKTVTWWISGQVVILTVYCFPIIQDTCAGCIFQSLIRIPTIFTGTKFVNEIQKGTSNRFENLKRPSDLESTLPLTKMEELSSPCLDSIQIEETQETSSIKSSSVDPDSTTSPGDVTNSDLHKLI